MLQTPFGTIRMLFDRSFANCEVVAIKPLADFPDVDGCFLLKYNYNSDGKPHTLECVFSGKFEESHLEPGERQECLSFYDKGGKLSLGCEGSFGDYPDGEYDYDGEIEEDRIVVEILSGTKSQTLYFAVCWMLSCTEKNEYQTWYGADAYQLRKEKVDSIIL